VLVVRGVIETNQGVVNLIAQHLTPLPGRLTLRSRDFR
jgi:hypothetical protein